MRLTAFLVFSAALCLSASSLPAINKGNAGPEKPEIVFKLPAPPPLTMEQELKTFALPPGFMIEAVAFEPLIESPIALSWDDQGRMYVVEMCGYMHDVDGKGQDEPLGRIKRLESTRGDGIYDKATIFVDKLIMPRAVMALGDGALVGEPPNLTWYHDTDGDGKADRSELVSDKFGTRGGQCEHMCNSPTWMLDNWIWCSAHGSRFKFQKGKFITEPAFGGGQWGLTQDDWGRQFFNYNSALLHGNMIPPQIYSRNPNLRSQTGQNLRVMTDQTVWPSHPTPGVNRGYADKTLRPDGTLAKATATCGPCVYRGDLFPEEFRGNVFIPEPSGNLVKRVILSESGGVVTAKNAYENREFLTSTDERFRPVSSYTGPDGALYIVDMYRGVLQEKAFLTHYLIANIKDRKLEQPVNRGRIWRIIPVGARPRLVKLPKETQAIVPFLAHPNGWVRDTAQRVLVERGDASINQLITLTAAQAPVNLPQARVQAMWTLEGLGVIPPQTILNNLADPHPMVRATAIRLADRTLVPLLLKLADDPDATVRLQLALRISGEPGPEVQQALDKILERGGSPLLAEAIASGLRGREIDVLESLLKLPESPAIDKSGIVPLLADCVMAEHKPGRVARLLELAAALPPRSPRFSAMLGAMEPRKRSKKSPPQKLIYLDSKPAALDQLATRADGKARPVIAAIDKVLAWPGKPGVPPPPKIIPLTADQQALNDKGRVIYANLCGACHQPSGAGLEGLAPPLLDSEWVLSEADAPIRILLQGVSGPLPVGGRTWTLEMPPLGAVLKDEDIAAALTYIRREWEHNASPVSIDQVAAIRAATRDRTSAWTAEELKSSMNVKGKNKPKK